FRGDAGRRRATAAGHAWLGPGRSDVVPAARRVGCTHRQRRDHRGARKAWRCLARRARPAVAAAPPARPPLSRAGAQPLSLVRQARNLLPAAGDRAGPLPVGRGYAPTPRHQATRRSGLRPRRREGWDCAGAVGDVAPAYGASGVSWPRPSGPGLVPAVRRGLGIAPGAVGGVAPTYARRDCRGRDVETPTCARRDCRRLWPAVGRGYAPDAARTGRRDAAVIAGGR